MPWDPHTFALAASVSPYHPTAWPGLVQVGFVLEQLAQFRADWRRRVADLDAVLCPSCGARRYVHARRCPGCRALRIDRIRAVRADLQQALAPLPSHLYTRCPCHPGLGHARIDAHGRKRWPRPRPDDDVTPAEVRAWIAAAPEARTALRPGLQSALAFLERFNPARRRPASPAPAPSPPI